MLNSSAVVNTLVKGYVCLNFQHVDLCCCRGWHLCLVMVLGLLPFTVHLTFQHDDLRCCKGWHLHLLRMVQGPLTVTIYLVLCLWVVASSMVPPPIDPQSPLLAWSSSFHGCGASNQTIPGRSMALLRCSSASVSHFFLGGLYCHTLFYTWKLLEDLKSYCFFLTSPETFRILLTWWCISSRCSCSSHIISWYTF